MMPILAVAATGAGVGMLYARWKSLATTGALTAVAWALLLIAAYAAAIAWGSEFGFIYFFALLAFIAWALIGREATTADRKPRPDRTGLTRPSASIVGRQVWRFLVVVPFAGLASVFLLVVLSRAVDLAIVDRTALTVLLLPVLWGALMVWALAQPRIAQPAITGLCALSGAAALAL